MEMSSDLFLGVDIGTTVIKGMIIDSYGNPVSQASLIRNNGDGAQYDSASGWWKGFVNITRKLLSRLSGDRRRIQCIAITAMVHNLLPVDSLGKPLHNPIMYYDGRASYIERKLDNEFGTTWQNQVLARLILLKKDLGRERWRDVNKILTTHNYLVFKLTEQTYVDTITSLECGTIIDSNASRWKSEILQRYNLGEGKLPSIVPPATIVGHVTKRAAEQTGLEAGLPVAAGTTDTIASLIGSGTRRVRDLMVSYGTYGCAASLRCSMNEVLFKRNLSYPIDWRASIPKSGQQLSAMARVLLPSRPGRALQRLDNLASQSVPGANGVVFLQTLELAKPTSSTEPRGVLLNLRRDSGVSDICRAFLEAFGYGLRYSFERLSSERYPDECFATSGGATSKTWRQIVGDITGLKQFYFPSSENGFGSAALAAISFDIAMKEVIKQAQSLGFETTIPNSGHFERYQVGYERYAAFLDRMSEAPTIGGHI